MSLFAHVLKTPFTHMICCNEGISWTVLSFTIKSFGCKCASHVMQGHFNLNKHERQYTSIDRHLSVYCTVNSNSICARVIHDCLPSSSLH